MAKYGSLSKWYDYQKAVNDYSNKKTIYSFSCFLNKNRYNCASSKNHMQKDLCRSNSCNFCLFGSTCYTFNFLSKVCQNCRIRMSNIIGESGTSGSKLSVLFTCLLGTTYLSHKHQRTRSNLFCLLTLR